MKVSEPTRPEEDAFALGFNSKLKLFVKDANRMAMNTANNSDNMPEDSLLAPEHAEDADWVQELRVKPLWVSVLESIWLWRLLGAPAFRINWILYGVFVPFVCNPF